MRGDCLYKLAEDIQRITCTQPGKIPVSMLIKVCETLGPLCNDNRMNSKIISKCCATRTVLEHFFRHNTPVTDVRYKDGLWMFDEYEMKGKLNKVKLDELRTLHDQMLQVSKALDMCGAVLPLATTQSVSGHTLASPCPDTGLAAGASRVHLRTHLG